MWRNLNTYSLELSFINANGKVQDGWLLENNQKNNSFMFVWLNDNTKKTHRTKYDEPFTYDEIFVAIVDKQKLLDYLASIEWSINKLKTKSNKIRYNKNEYLGNIRKNNCEFSFSKQLKEQPINIKLPKSKYIELADFTFSLKTTSSLS